MDQLMFPLYFHYEDVSRQDPLLKPNHANVMEVPGSCKIIVVPKTAPSIKNGKLAMEIPCGQKLKQRASTGKSFRSNPFLGSNKDKKGYVSDLARQSTLRGHGMSHFLVRISTVMSLLDSPLEIRERSIQFSMETEFCEFSPELEDHFEIFEHIRGFNVTIVTSANTQDETLPPWSGFLQKDEGETHISRSFDGHKEIVLVATTKPIEQGFAPQQVYKQDANGAGIEVGDPSTACVYLLSMERRSAEVVPIIEVRGAAKPNSIKERGLTFPEADSSYSNLAMLMEEEKFSDEMDPQEMSENPQLLRGRTLSRLQDDQSESAGEKRKRVEHIMRDVEGGWLLRYMHANGATFIGYVLPWGQMSFWGATVITSLASAIPVVGDTIVTWLWGASLLHLAALHQYGSNNPLGVHSEMDKIASYPYFYVKDLVGWVAFAIFFSIWIFYAPNVLGHPDNYIPANPMSTPPHIVPEWYFLPIHAILRSIPDKSGGVAAIAPVFICLLALPFFKSWIGCQPVEAPFVTIGQISPLVFFLFFAITPILGRVGRGIPNSYTDETDHT
ncbi:hypothetical protein KY290_004383 [Solanum tuberosum]|uniref:Cytochrome b n=1 Tax=Solanum tuberosum TaxID=4113 RepID=A0ABQ7WXU7_SOLTU|nr:hypothetical protein KY290_004383 [Solanum tuberosum]